MQWILSSPALRGKWLRLVIVVVIAAAIAAVAATGYFRAAENALQAQHFALADKSASGQIHVIEMDAASVAAIQEWPWSRDHYARIVDQLDAAGVRTIAFDVDFSSRSILGGDEEFAAALADATAPIIVPTFAQSASFASGRKLDALPIELLREHVKLGSVSIAPDSDGFIRRMPLGTETAGAPRPSLSAFLAQESGEAGASFPIDYSIDARTIPRHSFIAIERGAFDPELLRGKDVLIGATAIEMGDRYVVPRFGVLPGVIIQALATETLYNGQPVYGSWPLPLLLSALLCFFVLAARSQAATALRAALIVITVIGASHYAQLSLGLWFEIAPALLMVVIAGAIRLLMLARYNYILRCQTDPVSKLPNITAMAEHATMGERDYFIAAMIDGFDSLKAVLSTEELGLLLRRIVDRLQASGCGSAIYRTDDRVLSWSSSLDLYEIDELLTNLKSIMRSPIEIGGRKVDVSLSFGVAKAHDLGSIAHAGHAASAAMSKGEKWRLHEESQNEWLEQQVSLMGEMEAAIQEGHIKVQYQPKLDLKSNRITCAEALVRWEHPTRGMLPPDSFIPLAEESGRIEDLTLHVIKQTIDDMCSWCAQGLVLGAAVNISAKLLSSTSFIQRAEILVSRLGVPTSRLTFEVTESAELENTEVAIAALERLCDLGIAISMDDYGTGQSTLGYIKMLPLSELKIDRSFVQHAHQDRGDAMLVRSTIQLAHELGLKVVAEGIEEAECLEFLREIECDYAQGYFIGRPMNAEQLAELVIEQVPLRAAA